jgi:hypothetical protein
MKALHRYVIRTVSVFLLLLANGLALCLSNHRYSVHLWLSPRGEGDLSMKQTTYPFIVMTCYLINYNKGFTFYLRAKPGSARDVCLHLQTDIL